MIDMSQCYTLQFAAPTRAHTHTHGLTPSPFTHMCTLAPAVSRACRRVMCHSAKEIHTHAKLFCKRKPSFTYWNEVEAQCKFTLYMNGDHCTSSFLIWVNFIQFSAKVPLLWILCYAECQWWEWVSLSCSWSSIKSFQYFHHWEWYYLWTFIYGLYYMKEFPSVFSVLCVFLLRNVWCILSIFPVFIDHEMWKGQCHQQMVMGSLHIHMQRIKQNHIIYHVEKLTQNGLKTWMLT